MCLKLTMVLHLICTLCSGVVKELVFETADGAVTRQTEGRETVTYNSPKINLKEACDQIEIANNATIIADDKKNPVFVQTVVYVRPKEGELEKKIKLLKDELSEVTKFYGYYKVLIYIDKSLALIREFIDYIDINISINSMIHQKKIELIVPALKTTEDLCRQVKELFCEKKCKSTFFRHQHMWDCLCGSEKKIDFLKKEFERYNHYKKFPANDYNLHNDNKCKELRKLKEQFEKVRKSIYPMKEEDMKKHANLFEENLFIIIYDTYQNLKQCLEKEKTNLKWYFDLLEGILENILAINVKLKEFFEILIADDTKQE